MSQTSKIDILKILSPLVELTPMTNEFLRQSDICEMSANQQNVKLQSDSNQALNDGSKTSIANISDGASQQV